MTKYPNIEAIAAGTISGYFRDWIKVRPEAKALLATVDEQAREIERINADRAGEFKCGNCGELVIRCADTLTKRYDAAEAREKQLREALNQALEWVPLLNAEKIRSAASAPEQPAPAVPEKHRFTCRWDEQQGWPEPDEPCARCGVLYRDHFSVTAPSSVAAPAAPSAEPEVWQCAGCGEEFDSETFSHSRAEHAPGCDGRCRNCPVEVQCGPIYRRAPAGEQGWDRG